MTMSTGNEISSSHSTNDGTESKHCTGGHRKNGHESSASHNCYSNTTAIPNTRDMLTTKIKRSAKFRKEREYLSTTGTSLIFKHGPEEAALIELPTQTTATTPGFMA